MLPFSHLAQQVQSLKRTDSIKINCSNYLTSWLYFIFITSVVLTNLVKGMTVAFVMAYASILIPFITKSKRATAYYKLLFKLLAIYLVLCILSQIGVLIAGNLPPSDELILISPDKGFFLRSSLITQSLYVIPSFALFSFVVVYYTERHNSHLLLSLSIFVAFGFYEIVFYILFGLNGDFISNRVFGDGIENPAQFQIIILPGRIMSRFVSLTGEPSMYVYAIFPYFVYFLYMGKKIVTYILLLSLALTFSGTFAMGLFLLILSHFLIVERNAKRALILLVTLIGILLIIPAEILNPILKEVLFDKINQESMSGIERTRNFVNQMAFFYDLPIFSQLVGVGFGTIRSTDLFSTLLVNIGIVGLLLFSLLILYPVYKLEKQDNGLRVALLITFFILQITVSEYSYPSLWLILGIAYQKISQNGYIR